MKKRVISALLLILMLVTMLPVTALGAENWLWPVENCYIISSSYGLRKLNGADNYHYGIDIIGSKQTKGMEIHAAKSGTIYEACTTFKDDEFKSGSCGNYVAINHGDGTYSIYMHMAAGIKKTSGTVKQGEIIGTIGNTGESYGAHLHFQIYTNPKNRNGTTLNPMPTNNQITVNGNYNLPSGWNGSKITYSFTTCDHDWAKTGYCTKCKTFMPNNNDNATVKTGIYKVISNNAYLRVAPYQSAQKENGFTVITLSKGTTGINVTGGVINGFDNLWYKVTYNGETGYKTGYIVAGNLELDSIGSKPAKPANMTVTSYENSAYISWSAVSGATSYEVQFFSNKRGEWMSDASCYHGGTSYTSTGLEQDSYKFRVRAVNVYGVSDWAEGIYTKPSSSNPTTPTAPKNLTATYISDTQATISWSAVSGAASYEAQYYKITDKTYVTDTSYASPKTATSYKSSGLNTHNCFRFRVRAVGSSGVTSSWSEVVYVKPGKSHSYGSWVTTVAATHTASGSRYRICSECGYKQEETIPAIGHSYGTAWKTDATYHWHTCSCGAISSTAAHDFGSWVTSTAATHTANGSRYRTCNICGYKETQTISAIGHNYGTAWKSNATNHWHECSCGAESNVGKHSFGSWNAIKTGCSHKPGKISRTCTVCDYTETKEPAGIAVVYSGWLADDTAHWHECSCGEIEDTEAHSFNAWQTVTSATTKIPGLRKRVCQVCGWEEAKEIPILAKDFADLNGDKKIDAADLTLLARHLAKIEPLADTTLADVNGDKSVTAADLTALARLINLPQTA